MANTKIISVDVAMDAYDKSNRDAFSKWFNGAADEINETIKKHMDKSRSFCVSVHIPVNLQEAANWSQWARAELESAGWTCQCSCACSSWPSSQCTCDGDIHDVPVMLIELSW